jgi:MSHA biogenesis protein MshQ
MKLIPLFLIMVFVFGIIGPSPTRADPGWYDNDWGYRKKITINSANVSGSDNLTDFPVLISITDTDLITKALANGDDIVFTAGDEVTRRSHEIESYNATTGELQAWLRIPVLSPTTDTEIYMYYGNAGASNSENATDVWNSNYKMVQHMEEASGTNIGDSTSNSNNGTAVNSPTLGASGKVDGAIGFVGSSAQYVNCGNASSLDITGNITVEAWIYTDSSNTNKGIVTKYQGTAPSYYLLFDGTGHIDFVIQSSPLTLRADAGTPSTGNWHYVVGVYDESKVRIYLDGVETVGDDYFSTIDSTSSAVTIASWYNNASAFDFTGTIDEVRISNTNRSTDWITTGYNNQSNPGAFLSLGSEETPILAPTVTTSAATNVEETTATLNGNITATGGENADIRGFEWDTDSGAPYSTNWTESASYGTGAFTYGAPALTFARGELYYYRAMAHNSAGWSYGSEQTFLTKPDGPTGLTAVSQGDDWVYLTWSNGNGSDNTSIRYQIDTTPNTPSSGSSGYFGPGTSANVTGLSPGEDYFFSAWSYAAEGGLDEYSDLYSTANATTTGAPAPTVIGGKILTINKAVVLVPWLLLAAGACLVVINIIRYFRKKIRSRSHSETTR